MASAATSASARRAAYMAAAETETGMCVFQTLLKHFLLPGLVKHKQQQQQVISDEVN